MVSVGVWMEQLLHHGEEVPVNREDLLDVGEQHLEHKGTTQST